MYSKSRQLWLEQFANGEMCSFQTGIFWYFLGTGSKNDFTSWWCTVIKNILKNHPHHNNKSPILYICQNSTLMIILLESSDLGWPCWCLYLIPDSESSFSFSSFFFSQSKKTNKMAFQQPTLPSFKFLKPFFFFLTLFSYWLCTTNCLSISVACGLSTPHLNVETF